MAATIILRITRIIARRFPMPVTVASFIIMVFTRMNLDTGSRLLLRTSSVPAAVFILREGNSNPAIELRFRWGQGSKPREAFTIPLRVKKCSAKANPSVSRFRLGWFNDCLKFR